MKIKIPLEQMEPIAKSIVDKLNPHCERIEVAGSIRRRKAEVGDIEIVCIPKTLEARDLLGNVNIGTSYHFTEAVSKLGTRTKDGPAYKQIELDLGYVLDLFITTPEKWGVIFTIRTGSADFSKWLVTPRKWGGALPSQYEVRDGRVWCGFKALDTPEEIDFFRLCQLDYISPPLRSGPIPGRVAAS